MKIKDFFNLTPDCYHVCMKILRFRQHLLNLHKMSIFTQNVNPITGVTTWEEKDPDYDYYQEIARSAFADMLHDHERVSRLWHLTHAHYHSMHSQEYSILFTESKVLLGAESCN